VPNLKRLLTLALAALLTLCLTACDRTSTPAPPAPSTTATTTRGGGLPVAPEPEEDEPGFDCVTMGNKVCGPDTPVTKAADVAPVQHEVEVRVQADPTAGAVFRVIGEVFGDTGPINMPAVGYDGAQFTTTKAVGELDLEVRIGTGACEIYYDGRDIASVSQSGANPVVTICRVRGI